MRFFHYLSLLALLTFFSAGAALADERLSLKAGYLMLSPDGTFAASGSNLAGTPIDLKNDLRYDDSKDFFVEGALQHGSVRLTASYTPLEFSGQGSLNREVNFAGRTFSGTAQSASNVEIDLIDLGLTWFLINPDHLPFKLQLGPEIAVKLVMADMTLSGESTAAPGLRITEKESGTVPVPTLGARARLGISDLLAISGRVGYLEFDNNRFFDLDGQLEFSPVPLVGIFGGYRYLDIKVDESDVFIDASFSGPYLGAFVRF
ncbi:hypothetical protein [Desulfurivibrio sp. C05AmB]|jgi:hypothetical protein|uniref:hypothetical protein n=1 Tax=Desulfurivibrio sp. C05AmB TaxID=3374371 RepID=UPI00376EB2B8